MAVPKLGHITPDAIASAVGFKMLQRGWEYAHNRVLQVAWDPDEDALHGTVLGHGSLYDVAAWFDVDRCGLFELADSECSCPVGYHCKHVAAIVLLGAGLAEDSACQPTLRPPAGAPLRPRAVEPSWEQTLTAMLPAALVNAADEAPLAIALELQVAPAARAAPPTLTARVMRPGRREAWVNDGLAWSSLDSYTVQRGRYVAEHVLLLQELYAIHRVRSHQPQYSYYGGSTAKTIDLGGCDSPQLWSLLDEAARIGVALIHGDQRLGAVEPYRRGEVCLDVTGHGRASSEVAATLRVDHEGVDPAPVLFIGASAHGVVYVDRAPVGVAPDLRRARLHLARLDRPVPPQLRRMILGARPVEIPAEGQARFVTQLWPRLRHLATVVSSDGSFTPPAISAPTLVLQAEFAPQHSVELAWAWEYEVGETRHQLPLDAPSDHGLRDLAAERALVSSLDVGLGGLGLLGADGRLRPHAVLTGMDTVRVATELLPLLAGQPGVTVELEGQPSDYREVGDSLVIAVATADIAGQPDWFDLDVSITVDGCALPFAEVFLALASGESHLLLDDGAYFSLHKPELQSLRHLIDEARALQDGPSGPLRLSRFQAGLWQELAELGVIARQSESWQRQVGGLLELDAIDTPDVPASLRAHLRPYQAEGFGWLAFLWRHRLGGILADDMGLGKTVQALALICHARETAADLPPFLVLAPTSVVSNWVSEAARFAPHLSVVAVDSTLQRAGRSLAEVVAGAHVVVTSYTLFRLDFEAYGAKEWSGLLLDEAQQTKNHQSKVYGCIRRLAAGFKLAITGTPMENNLMELWSLLSITAPGLFPSPKRFEAFYARPIQRRGDPELLAQLRRRVRPLVKRRTKEQVAADLPAKQEQVLEVELHPRHRKLYQTQLQRERQRVLGLLEDFDRNRFTVLRSLTLLRQLSLHPALTSDTHAAVPCAKLDVLVEQLGDVITGGHRALVFSQFTSFLALVRQRVQREGIAYCYLDGSTRKREAVLRDWKDGTAPVFLISLKAGGSGLNLSEADYCFLLDPWWNPATEAQAVGRIHRIGQTRNVMAYRLIAKDTIEEKVLALSRRKAELFSGVMDEGQLFGGSLTSDDIRILLG